MVTPKVVLNAELLFVVSRGLHDIPICALARGARQWFGPVWAWGRKAVPGMWANLEDVWCSRERGVTKSQRAYKTEGVKKGRGSGPTI